jgi:hypothetical protein
MMDSYANINCSYITFGYHLAYNIAVMDQTHASRQQSQLLHGPEQMPKCGMPKNGGARTKASARGRNVKKGYRTELIISL